MSSQGTQAGRTAVGRHWEAQAQEAFLDLREWRALHPQATLAEIERELDRRLEVLRARLLADLALASQAADLQGREGAPAQRARCPRCGTPLHDGGVHQRTLVTLGNHKVALVRDYGTCPGCGSGLFPPGR
jgi:ribosomal protein S27AE